MPQGTEGGRWRRSAVTFGAAGTGLLLAAFAPWAAASPGTAVGGRRAPGRAQAAVAIGAGRPAAVGGRGGGSLTVLESFLQWPAGLDPQTDPQAMADASLEDAIFGQLFELGPGGRIVDDLASGSRLSADGRTLTIEVRRGVTFSDGAPFTAAAVAANLRADLGAACACRPSWPVTSISTPGTATVVVRLGHPDGAILDQLVGSIANWVVDPRALRSMGASAYAQAPVGAGPFEVVSDVTNDRLVLRRNPRYWQAGRPYLSGLTFQTIALPTQAVEDLRSGAGQALEAMGSPGLVRGFTAMGCTATLEPSTSVLYVGLDVAAAPFDRAPARRAVYAATDAAALDKVLNGGAVPVAQSFTGPTGRFYEARVPGYPTYDLATARRLVRRLGGLRFTLAVSPFIGRTLGAALQSMYDEAGMHVTLSTSFIGGRGAFVGSLGSFDPAGPSGLQRFAGVPVLGGLLARAGAATGTAARGRAYAAAAEQFTKDGLGPFLYAPAIWSIACGGVRGPGLTTTLPGAGSYGPAIAWQDVSLRR